MRTFDLPTLLQQSLGVERTGPKHAELSGCIKKAIASGVLTDGDRLPAEAELVATTPYSLGTVQRAIRTLVEEGLVERKPKLGTFVAQRRKIEQPWHFRFLDSDRQTVLPVYPKVVSRSTIRQRGPWNDYLTGPLLRIDRLVNVNDEFNAYSRFFIDSSRFPIFEGTSVEALHGKNFRALLNTQIDEPISKLCRRILLCKPSSHVALQIGVSTEQVCTHVEIAASAKDEDFLYFQELIVPPSDRRLDLAEPNAVQVRSRRISR